MRKVILMCEGATEKKIVTYLLDNDLLIFSKEELLDEKVHAVRQPKQLAHLINLLPQDTQLLFCRIGDTLKDELNFDGIRQTDIIERKYCTKTEIEMLGIIKADKINQYNKQKLEPKEFLKSIGITNFVKYICDEDIIEILETYKSYKKHNKGEEYLADLVKK